MQRGQLMKKRGQVTLFVIVGIILVLVIALFIFVLRPEQLERDQALVDEVSSEFSPVQNFVHSCMRKTGEDAVRILGERGGYLFNDNYHLSSLLNPDLDNPSDADSFYVHQAGRMPVPYWYFMDSPNGQTSVSFSSKKPVLNSPFNDGINRDSSDLSIEAQIDRYVELMLFDCLNNYQSLREQGLEIEELIGVPITTTYVTEEDVIINVHFPLDVKSGTSSEIIKNFGVHLPVRLKDAYQLAELITDSESNFKFLEHQMQELLTFNGNRNSPYLPPMYDFEFAFGSEGNTWAVADVKENVKFLLSYAQFLQVEGSRNYNPILLIPSDSLFDTRQRIYDNMVLPFSYYYSDDELDELNLRSTDVNFNYLGNEIYFYAGDGAEIEPTLFGVDFSSIQFGMQNYETFYDISWPVLVTLTDGSAFNGEGFVFQFGLEGNLRDNDPIDSSYNPNLLSFDSGPSLCDPGLRNVNASVHVFDDRCNTECQPVPNAAVSIVVVDGSCFLGITNASGTLNTLFPSGFLNGQVKVAKEGYLGETVSYAPDVTEYTIRDFKSMKNMKFSVLKKILKKENHAWSVFEDDLVPLQPGDDAIVTFNRVGSFEEVSFSTAISLNSTHPVQETLFVDGEYEIKVMLLGPPDPALNANYINSLDPAGNLVRDLDVSEMTDEQRASFEEQQRSFDDQIELLRRISDVGDYRDYPGSGPVQTLKGGSSFGFINESDPGIPVMFSKFQIKNGEEIVLYAIELKDLNISDIDDFTIVSDLDELTRQNVGVLIPEVK